MVLNEKELSQVDRARLEKLLLSFDEAWQPGSCDAMVEGLRSEPSVFQRIAGLELIKIDLHRQWEKGEGTKVDSYTSVLESTGFGPDIPAELILAEFLARHAAGKASSAKEYQKRFPKQFAEFKKLFDAEKTRRSGLEKVQASINTDAGKYVTETRPEGGGDSQTLPETFGRYKIIRRLGSGAMGAVYLALDTQLDRKVALKTPSFGSGVSNDLVQRFYREARAAANLRHANICTVFDVGEIDGRHYITMDYIDGRPLSAYIGGEKPLEQKAVAGIVRKLALALADAHEAGVIHRDLKPDNVMVDENRQPLVMDFGLARREDELQSRMTQSGTILGTPAYMSPEQVKGQINQIGPQADIYSLGILLYELLTGKLPFEGSVAAVIGQILTEAPPPLSQSRSDVDPVLETICLKMIAKEQSDRYATMKEVATDLAKYMKGSVPKLEAVPPIPDVVDPFSGLPVAKLVMDPVVRPATKVANAGTFPKKSRAFWRSKNGRYTMIGGAIAVLVVVIIAVIYVLQLPKGTLATGDPESADEVNKINQQMPEVTGETVSSPSSFGPSEILTSNQWTWGEPVAIGHPIDLETDRADRMAISADGLTAFFGRGKDVWSATRTATGSAFAPPVNLGFNTGAHEGAPALSADGLHLLFDALNRNDGVASWDIWMSSRSSLNELFGKPKALGPNINTVHAEAAPTITGDLLTLLFHSDRSATNEKMAIWQSTRASTKESFGPAKLLGRTINSDHVEGDPAISADGLTLIFVSDRPGGQGGTDLWMATRSYVSTVFGRAVNLGPKINGPNAELKPSLSPDGQTLYYLTNPLGRPGDRRLMMVRRIRKPVTTNASDQSKPVETATAAESRSDYGHLLTGSWDSVMDEIRNDPDKQHFSFYGDEFDQKKGWGSAFDKHRSRNAIIRAKVKILRRDKNDAHKPYLILRWPHPKNSAPETGNYAFKTYIQGWSRMGIEMRTRGRWINLREKDFGRRLDEYFEWTLAMIDDQITVYVDGKLFLSAHAPNAVEDGIPFLSVGELARMKDVEIMILDKKKMAGSNSSGIADNKPYRSGSGDTGWTDLFNAKDLTGFTRRGGNAKFELSDRILTGTSLTYSASTYLCTNKEYENFILEYEFKVDPPLNSGVQIRSLSKPGYKDGRVHGYQVEIDGSGKATNGAIYDEAGRGWLDDLANNERAQNAFSQNQWNQVTVVCDGDSIKTWLNGIQAADINDDMTARGFIAFQIHGIRGDKDKRGKQVRWRKVRIKELPAK